MVYSPALWPSEEAQLLTASTLRSSGLMVAGVLQRVKYPFQTSCQITPGIWNQALRVAVYAIISPFPGVDYWLPDTGAHGPLALVAH